MFGKAHQKNQVEGAMNTCLGYIEFTKDSAVKHVKVRHRMDSAEDPRRERKVMRLLKNVDGVVSLLEEEEKKYTCCEEHLVTPLCNGGDLFNHVFDRADKGEFEKGHETFVNGMVVKQYIVDLLDIVKRVHDKGVVHLDLSPENVCLHDGRPVLIDFGCGQEVVKDRIFVSALAGKQAYRAPELGAPRFQGVQVDPYKVDVFAVGIMLYVLTTGNFLFEKYSDANWRYMWRHRMNLGAMLKKRLAKIGAFHEDDYMELLARALEMDPSKRATMEELVNHPFVTKIKK